jgi:hypothetical protein
MQIEGPKHGQSCYFALILMLAGCTYMDKLKKKKKKKLYQLTATIKKLYEI